MRARREASLDEDNEEELDPDSENVSFDEVAFSGGLEIRDEELTAYQIRQAVCAETVDAEEREEIFSRIRHTECFYLVPRPDAEGLDSDPSFSEASAAQERERLIRERTRLGTTLTPEERAELTVRIIQLESWGKHLVLALRLGTIDKDRRSKRAAQSIEAPLAELSLDPSAGDYLPPL